MEVFGERLPAVFTHGKSAKLYDETGKEYTDFLAGIAVNCLGYSDEGFKAVLKAQVDALLHTCNYFYNEPQTRLAQMLCEKTGFARVFFSNSGAEANECALKLAKKYTYHKGSASDRFVALRQSFHGRTLATLTATGQERFHLPFRPMVYDFTYIDANDIDAAKAAISADVCGVILEIIQGESGVFPLDQAFVSMVRALCDMYDVPFIIDEVQTGMGRTGKWLAQEHYNIKADITTLAKALGSGVPIGACLANEKLAAAFGTGDHGSTFGGNPLACAAGSYVTQKIDDVLLTHIMQTGTYFKEKLMGLQQLLPQSVLAVRGMGLMLGAQLNETHNAHDIQVLLLKEGFVIGTAGNNTLRFVPPFVIEKADVDDLIAALTAILR